MDIVAEAFDATGARYAVAYAGLDGHRLRVGSVEGSTPPVEVSLDGTRSTSVAWAPVNAQQVVDKQPHKKRRRHSQSHHPADQEIVVVGTAQGVVLLYSPSANSVVTKLVEPGSRGSNSVVDLTVRRGQNLVVLHADGQLAEWDLGRQVLISSVLTQGKSSLAVVGPQTIVAATQPYSIGGDEVAFQGFATPIAQVLALGSKYFAARAKEDRQVLVYQLGDPRPTHSLMCPTTNAVHISGNDDILAVTTEDGLVQLFSQPTQETESRTSVSQLQPSFSVRLSNGKILATDVVSSKDLIVMSLAQAVPVFTRVHIDSSSEDIVAVAPEARKVGSNITSNVDPAAAPVYRDQAASVAAGTHVAALSDSESESEDETLADRLEALGVRNLEQEESSGDYDNNDVDAPETRSPSRRNKEDLRLRLAQPGSFAALLSQALKLGDKQLIELTLEERDEDMIKASIYKLEPNLVAQLIEQLAATMARSENRNLVKWVKWSMIIHGGYLITVPNLLKTLAALHSTMSARVATLPRLFALQGRLELLEQQISVRRDAASAAAREIEDDAEDIPEVVFNEEAIIVNGEEDFSDEDGPTRSDVGDSSDSEDNDSQSEADVELDGFEDEGFNGMDTD